MASPQFPEDKVRSAQQVAKRALTLFNVWVLTSGATRDEVIEWFDEEGLRSELTPFEARFLADADPPRQAIVNMSWNAERLIVLLWALNVIDALPAPDEQCDTSLFRDLPPYGEQSAGEFVKAAQLRSHEELREMAWKILDLHWEARDASLNNKAPRTPVNIEMIQERHHAINWITGYGDLPWDDVTTDT